jgi:hypothetical protein
MNQKTYLTIVRDSLRRTIQYYQNSLNKFKKNKKFNASRFFEHKKALENSQKALEQTVHALVDLKD